jgi:hypothetical protein
MFVNAIRYRKEKDGHGWLYSIFGKRERNTTEKCKLMEAMRREERKKEAEEKTTSNSLEKHGEKYLMN